MKSFVVRSCSEFDALGGEGEVNSAGNAVFRVAQAAHQVFVPPGANICNVDDFFGHALFSDAGTNLDADPFRFLGKTGNAALGEVR